MSTSGLISFLGYAVAHATPLPPESDIDLIRRQLEAKCRDIEC